MKIKEITTEVEFEVSNMEISTVNQHIYNLADGRTVVMNPTKDSEGNTIHKNEFFVISDETPLAPENVINNNEVESEMEKERVNTIEPKPEIVNGTPSQASLASQGQGANLGIATEAPQGGQAPQGDATVGIPSPTVDTGIVY